MIWSRVILALPTLLFTAMTAIGAILVVHDLKTTIGAILIGSGGLGVGYWEIVVIRILGAQKLKRGL